MNETNFRVKPKALASKEKRFLNFIIDSVVYQVLNVIIYGFLAILSSLGFYGPLEFFLEWGLVGDLLYITVLNTSYFFFLEGKTQRSLGKYLTNTMVVMEDGSKPGSNVILTRSLCRMIPFEAFSFLGELGRGWHDTLSDTYVVDIKKFEESKITESEIDLIGTTPQF